MKKLLLAIALLFQVAHTNAQGRGPLWILGKTPDRNPYGCTASTSGTYVPTVASITTTSCEVWSLDGGASPNTVILRNGSQVCSAFGAQIEWYNGVLYVQGDDLNWYTWSGLTDCFILYGASDPSGGGIVPPTGYFVSSGVGPGSVTAGLDSRNCMTASNVATPKLTLNSAMTCLATPGSTLYVRGGNYNESLVDNIPSGTGALSSQLVRIAAYPGESPWMRPTSGNWVIYLDQGQSYIEIDGLNIDGNAGITDAAVMLDDRDLRFPHHITLKNLEVSHRVGMTGGSTNAAVTAGGHDHLFYNMNVHGTGGPYAFYIHGQRNVIDGNNLHDTAEAFVQVYHNGGSPGYSVPTDNVVKNNYMHGLTTSNFFNADDGRLWGVITYGTSGTLIYNNFITGIAYVGSCPNVTCPVVSFNGIDVGGSATGTKIFNNTIYNNAATGIHVDSTSTTTTIRNNISYLNTTANYTNDAGGSTTESNGLYGTNPIFVNPGAANYRLQSSSPARDVGFDLHTFFTTDFEGTPRPQGSAWDIGYAEYH